MRRSLPRLQKALPPLTLAVSLFFVYSRTLAPGLSWANGGSDGGDLITAASTGGVPHPTGYPLYLLIAHLFQLLPIGSLAFRTNLMSAIFAALAAVLVYEIVKDSQLPEDSAPGWLSGMVAGYAFGLAPLVWSQAVITEVYALQSFLTALILYLYTKPSQPVKSAQKRLDAWRGLVLGLATGNHLTTILLVPAALLAGSLHRRTEPDGAPHGGHPGYTNLRFDPAALLRQLGWYGAALSLYLILPLRAVAQPPVNWGNVVTLDRLWWLMSGQLYQSYYLEFTPAEIWESVRAVAANLLQFGLPAILMGMIGLIVFGTASRLTLFTAWTVAVHIGVAVVYRSGDSHMYLIPVLLCFSIWIGLGLHGLARQWMERSSLLRIGLCLLMIGYFGVRAVNIIGQVDASQDVRAEAFGREVLSRAPQSAILFADGDQAIFTLWYFHFARQERPDLSVVAGDLLHFDWYQENLRATYPSLIVPGPFPWPETIAIANPSRAVCYAQYSDHSEINCSEPGTSP